jgi:hypothetical protein
LYCDWSIRIRRVCADVDSLLGLDLSAGRDGRYEIATPDLVQPHLDAAVSSGSGIDGDEASNRDH